MKKSLAITTLLLILFSPLGLGEISVINEHKGLQRLEEDKIENGAHARFSNVYVTDEGNIRVVKGRDKLNSTATADPVVNMLCYYENTTGSTKKYVVKESDEIVTYNTDWTSRTSIGTGLVNEKADCVQIQNTLYITSPSHNLVKWTGSGNVSTVGGVSAPTPSLFFASSSAGGLTSGEDATVAAGFTADPSCSTSFSGTCVARPCIRLASSILNNDGEESGTKLCTSLDSAWETICATNSTYKYKFTSYNKEYGIESEAGNSVSVNLTGSNTVTWSLVQGVPCDVSSATCIGENNVCEPTIEFTYTGKKTATSATLGSAPLSPFNQYCIYRTVANGDEYFLVGCSNNFGGSFTDGKPDTSLTRPLDTTIDTITPPTFRYIDQYKGSLFLAEGNEVRFTRLPVLAVTNADNYWLETDLLKTGLTKSITGLHSLTNNILIFTSDTVLSLSGFGVDSFRLSTLLTGIGTTSDETIETDNNGDIIFFAGIQGVYKLRLGQQLTDDLTGAVVNQPATNVVRVSSPFLDDVFNGTDEEIVLDPADYSSAHAYYDRDNDYYFLYIGEHSFLFNNKSAQWSYIPATEMIASVYKSGPTEAGQGLVIDSLGFAYNNWKGYENGVESGTVTGKPTSSTSTSLTDSGASYNISGDGLKGAWVFVDNENGEYRQIQSNTATSITVSPAWTTDPTTADDYYIGYIVVDFKTKQYNLVQPPARNKVDNLYLVHSKSDSSQELELITYEEKSTVPNNLKPIDLSENYVDKRNMPMGRGKYWYQWQGRSFVYNTSNTISPPVEIQSYAVDWQETENL